MVIPIATSLKMEDLGASEKSGRRSRLPNGDLLDIWLQKHNNLYPSREQKQRLAEDTQMTVDQVCRWFANRRRNKPYLGRGRRKTGERSSGTNTPQSCTSDEARHTPPMALPHLSNNNNTGLTFAVKETERRVADSNNNRSGESTVPSIIFRQTDHSSGVSGLNLALPNSTSSTMLYPSSNPNQLLTPPALTHPHLNNFLTPPTYPTHSPGYANVRLETAAIQNLHTILSNPFLSAYINPLWAMNMPNNYMDTMGGSDLSHLFPSVSMLSPREVSSPSSSLSSAAPSVLSPGMQASDGQGVPLLHCCTQEEGHMDVATETAVEALLQLSEKESIAVAVLAEFQRQKRKLQDHEDSLQTITVHNS